MTDPVGTLAELDVVACFRLLEAVPVGRVAVPTPSGAPHVVPVTYVVDGETIVFRTGAGSKLDGLLDGPASFEVDVIDPYHRVGWSVLVQGVAEEIEPDETLGLRPWLAGELVHWIRIVPVTVAGRLLTMDPGQSADDRGYV